MECGARFKYLFWFCMANHSLVLATQHVLRSTGALRWQRIGVVRFVVCHFGWRRREQVGGETWKPPGRYDFGFLISHKAQQDAKGGSGKREWNLQIVPSGPVGS